MESSIGQRDEKRTTPYPPPIPRKPLWIQPLPNPDNSGNDKYILIYI